MYDCQTFFSSIYSVVLSETYFFDNEVQQWNNGPQMAIPRYNHGCGYFNLENKLVLIVAGNGDTTYSKSVEFLDLSDAEPSWIAG